MAEQPRHERSLRAPDGRPVRLESITGIDELRRRPSRPPDYEAESRALVTLAQALADSPQTILQGLAEAVLQVLQCDSAGLSLPTKDGQRVHWPAIAGALQAHTGGETPRGFGRDVLDADAPVLLRHSEDRDAYFPAATPPIEECLLVPFHVRGKAVGTIWATVLSGRRRFNAEDLRQLESLGRFASAAYQAVESLNAAAEQRRAALNLMEDAIRGHQALETSNRELRDSEQRFSRFMQHLPGLAWIKGPDGRYVYVNDAAEKAFNVRRAELYGKVDGEVFSAETAEEFTRNDRRALDSESSIQTIEKLKYADGLVHHSVVSKFVIPGTDGKAAMVGGVAIDITELKRAEEALRQSEATFRTLAEASPGLIWRLDPDGRFAYVNPRFLEFFGEPCEAVLGEDWHSFLHADDAPAYLAALADAQRNRGRLEATVRINDRRGASRWLECHALPLFGAGDEYVGHVGFSLDVTTRTAVEREHARLAAVVESSDDAIVSMNLDGLITSWNLGALHLYGHTAEEAVGQSVTLLIPPDRLDEEPRVLERVRRGESVDHYETVRRRKDGTLVDVSLTVSPIRNREGQVIGASKIARDITANKQAAEMLHQADRRKNEFLAMLAHELRNPLSPILVALEILRRARRLGAPEPAGSEGTDATALAPKRDLSHRAADALDVLERQVGQLVRLVDDLLDAGRISRGKLELRKERVELSSVVHHALEAVRPLFEGRGLELAVTLPTMPVYLNADPTRLAQIVGNLLNNACKFTDQGGHVWLHVDLEEGPGGDGAEAAPGVPSSHVAIRVRDTGIGIAEDQLPRVFEMFAQVDTSLERSLGGLGIGLTLVKTLAVMHGGTVEVSSGGIGQGSEFVVRLPVLSDTATEASRPTMIEPTAPPLRILVVDDNRDAADSLAMLLKLGGHETYTAHDGLAAVDAAARLEPDVILLDIGLPGLNGYEAARRIRERQRGPAWPVLVALTGWGQEEDRQRSQEAGFDLHVVKPVNPDALGRLLVEVGAGKQSLGR